MCTGYRLLIAILTVAVRSSVGGFHDAAFGIKIWKDPVAGSRVALLYGSQNRQSPPSILACPAYHHDNSHVE